MTLTPAQHSVPPTSAKLRDKKSVLGAGIGSVVGGIAFCPPITANSPIIMLNRRVNANSVNVGMVERLIFLIPLLGVIIGGAASGQIGKNKTSIASFKSGSSSIVLGLIALFGVIGSGIGVWLSGILLCRWTSGCFQASP